MCSIRHARAGQQRHEGMPQLARRPARGVKPSSGDNPPGRLGVHSPPAAKTRSSRVLWARQRRRSATARSSVGCRPSRHTRWIPRRGSDAASRVSYLVAEVQRAGSFEGTDQVERYVLGWEVVEQPATLPQEYRPQLDVDQIKYAGLQALLRGVGTVQHNVAVTSCCFRLLHARLDAVGDVMNPLEGVLRRWLVSRDEDRHAVVVV